MDKNYFQELNDIDVSKYVEKKQNLSYLSWSYAWTEAKKRYPDMQDKIYERVVDEFGNTVNYFTDGKTCWVKVGVTMNGIEHIVELPVMDYKNSSIALDKVTSYDVNKAIQRCTTKAIAKHGIGLYIYAGEDLPEVLSDEQKAKEEEEKAAQEVMKKSIESVTKKGTTLIKAGATKEQIMEIVAKHNDGNGNPSSIKSTEICDAIIADFNKLQKEMKGSKE